MIFQTTSLPSVFALDAAFLRRENLRCFLTFRARTTDVPSSRLRFLGAFAKLRKGAISFVMSVHLSFRPHGITRLPLNGFSWNLIFHNFSKICPENSSVIKIGQEQRVLYMKANAHFLSYLAHFYLGWEMLQTKVVEKIKTHILFSVLFFLSNIVPFMR